MKTDYMPVWQNITKTLKLQKNENTVILSLQSAKHKRADMFKCMRVTVKELKESILIVMDNFSWYY